MKLVGATAVQLPKPRSEVLLQFWAQASYRRGIRLFGTEFWQTSHFFGSFGIASPGDFVFVSSAMVPFNLFVRSWNKLARTRNSKAKQVSGTGPSWSNHS